MYGTDVPFSKCTAFEEGQVYISEDGAMPDGFCNWAWRDIYKDLSILNFGGTFGLTGLNQTRCSRAAMTASGLLPLRWRE